MQEYLADVFVCHENTAIFVERTQSDGKIRRGIVMAIDLEAYDYKKGADSLIRATEATVVERIPPRVAIRRNAAIELPHVMLLIDDPDRTVIEPLIDGCEGEVAYDTELMLGGGHLKGRFLSERNFEEVSRALDALITPEAMKARYGADGLAPLLFAVGDGNHSLASAKAAYEEIKKMRENGGSNGKNSSGRGGYQSYAGNNSSTGDPTYAEIRRHINSGNVGRAEQMLYSVAEHLRNAEWNFLMGCVMARRGNYVDAQRYFDIACSMDPYNNEYRAAQNELRNRANGYGGGYRTTNSGGCSGCDVCSGLLCADCCCECCGGDLISCC